MSIKAEGRDLSVNPICLKGVLMQIANQLKFAFYIQIFAVNF